MLDLCIDCGQKNSYTGYRCRKCQSRNNKEWKEENREELNRYNRERYKNNMQFRIASNLRCRMHQVIKNKCGSSINLLGCSWEDLINYLEEQFDEEMNWDNYGDYWHIDHIKPCAAFDLTKEQEQKECFHYTNLQPLSAIENLQKGSKWNGA